MKRKHKGALKLASVPLLLFGALGTSLGKGASVGLILLAGSQLRGGVQDLKAEEPGEDGERDR